MVVSSETDSASTYVTFLGERLSSFNHTLQFLQIMAELDSKLVTWASEGLTADGSANVEQPLAVQEEDPLPMFPYLSDGESERCVLRTPVVFVDLT